MSAVLFRFFPKHPNEPVVKNTSLGFAARNCSYLCIYLDIDKLCLLSLCIDIIHTQGQRTKFILTNFANSSYFIIVGSTSVFALETVIKVNIV